MTDPEVVTGDEVLDDDIESEEEEDERDKRRWGLLIAALILLLLLLCCVVTSASVWVTRGPEQARFVARNIECLQCHTELIPEFKRQVVHNPFALKECTACHTPHGKKVSVSVVQGPGAVWRRYTTLLQWLPLKWWFTLSSGRAGRIGSSGGGVDEDASKSVEIKGDESVLIMDEDKLCFLCHGDMGAKLADPFQHQPFQVGRCMNCHDPHASDYVSLINQAPDKICLTCHPIGAELMRAQAHPPVAEGWCIDCHDPHASKFKGMLGQPQKDLCYQCHPTVAMLDGMPVQHAPFHNGECTDCHEPHGSNYRPLLDAVEPSLCYKCHPGIQNQFAQNSHHPVGVNLTCSSCHDPHAAQYEGLVNARDNSFCYQCHSQVSVSYEPSAHFNTLCIRCHTPHGSAYGPMLRRPNPPLCLECHNRNWYDEGASAGTADRDNHPVRPTHYDRNAREQLTCTTSCHDPHGTKNTKMLRYFNADRDGGCLMCHAVKSSPIVGFDF